MRPNGPMILSEDGVFGIAHLKFAAAEEGDLLGHDARGVQNIDGMLKDLAMLAALRDVGSHLEFMRAQLLGRLESERGRPAEARGVPALLLEVVPAVARGRHREIGRTLAPNAGAEARGRER